MKHELDLILAFEELDGDDRRRAEAHLAGCAECRELLARLQGLDAAARPLELTDEPLAGLSAAERAAAGTSREAMLRRLALGSSRTAWWRRRGTGLGALALAATLTAVVWLGSPGDRDDLPFANQRLAAQVVARDGAVQLAVGDPLTIRLTPERDGWPVVVRVSQGRAELMHPVTDQTPWTLRAGKPAILPPLGSGPVWALGDGDQWFLALAEAPVADVTQLADELAAGDVAKVLEQRFGHAAWMLAP